jgi:hypothetical protein
VQARTRAVLYERFVMYYVWQCLHYCGGVCVGLNHGHAHTVHLQHYNTHFQCQRCRQCNPGVNVKTEATQQLTLLGCVGIVFAFVSGDLGFVKPFGQKCIF